MVSGKRVTRGDDVKNPAKRQRTNKTPSKRTNQAENNKDKKKKKDSPNSKSTANSKTSRTKGNTKKNPPGEIEFNKNQPWNKDKKPPEVKPDEITCLFNEIYAEAEVEEAYQPRTSKLRDMFIQNLANLDGRAKILRPTLEILDKRAMDFLLSIYNKDSVSSSPPSPYIFLNDFLPLMTSLKVGELALNKTDDNKTYCLRLRYFAGFDLDKEEELVCQQPNIKSICKLIADFLSNQFDGTTETSEINKCVHKARLLYITAQYNGEIPTEAIVSCINFALLPGRGLFVNWLATSSEAITEEKYGRDFYHLCRGGTWVGRNLGLFVLQAAHLATYSHLTFANPILPNYIIAVQACIQKGPRSHNFYMRNGFVSTEQTVERIS